MILTAAACTHVGLRRKVNEDRYAMAQEHGLFLVADGMGGHRAGQVASELAANASTRTIAALQGTGASLTEMLRHAVSAANHEIFQRASDEPELQGMGTTLVSILASGERIALAHVGDSRAYLLRDGRVRRLTDDNSVVGELLRRREISEADAREHPHRHVLTRALGVRDVTVPDLAELTPQLGDVFVLCSDGLTTHVRDEELPGALPPGCDLQKSCDALVEAANRRGGLDNTTVVLVRVEPPRAA